MPTFRDDVADDCRDTAITSWVRENVPGPHTAGFEVSSVNEMAYIAVDVTCTVEPAEATSGAETPNVPSNNTRPVKDAEAV